LYGEAKQVQQFIAVASDVFTCWVSYKWRCWKIPLNGNFKIISSIYTLLKTYKIGINQLRHKYIYIFKSQQLFLLIWLN